MSWWEAVILGLIQGIAEFLPISSSGHLVLGQYFLGVDEPSITFEVFVHFGTVLSILTVYRRRVWVLLKDSISAVRQPGVLRAGMRAGAIEHAPEEPYRKEYDGEGPTPAEDTASSVRLVFFTLLSMIPTGIIYVLFGDWLESLFENPNFVCAMLLVTAVLLILAGLRKHPDGVLSPWKSLLVGLAQGAAMIPGISRSGSTICTAIYINVDRKDAADFSFLMSLPVIIGATGLKVVDLIEVGAEIDLLPLVLGTLIAYLSGIWAIKVVIDFVQRGSLNYFAYYLVVAGTLGLLLI